MCSGLKDEGSGSSNMEEMGEASVESDQGQEEATQKGGKEGKKHKKNKKNVGALREVNNRINIVCWGYVATVPIIIHWSSFYECAMLPVYATDSVLQATSTHL